MTPETLRLSPARETLTVAWKGQEDVFSAEFLRVESPSAEVKGHGVSDARLVPGKRGVTILALEPVGNYAVRIVFSDGHRTGLYSWDYLHELGRSQKARWAAYETDMAAAGLSRDAAAPPVLRARSGV